MIHKNRTKRKYLLVIFLIILLVLIAFSPGLSATKTTILEGRVINGTTGKPQANFPVMMDIFLGKQKMGVRETTSDKEGFFKFDEVPLGKDYSGLVYAQHQGAEYQSIVDLTEKPKQPVELKIYNSSKEDKDLKISEYHIQLEEKEGKLLVTEFILIQNNGKTSFVIDNKNPEKPLGLILGLPRGYQNLQMYEGLMKCCSEIKENKIFSYMSIPPGENRMVYSYELSSDSIDLSKKVPFNTEEFFLIVVDKETGISSGKLTSEGTKESQQGDVEFRLFSAKDIKKGEIVDINISRETSEISYQKVLIIPVAVFLAIGIGYLILKRRGEKKAKSLSDVRVLEGLQTDIDPAEELKKVYLEFIVRLDELFEEGELSEQTHLLLRKKYKEKLSKLMEEKENED